MRVNRRENASWSTSFNYQRRGMTPVIFTAALDDRYGIGKVSSRIGLQSEAQLFKTTPICLTRYKNNEEKSVICVLISECGSYRRAVYQLTEVVDKAAHLYFIYGLRTDFLGELFER